MINKQLVAHNFSRSSTEYESVALCQNYAAGRFAGMIADSINDKESPKQILEIGCGTGFLTKTLIGLFPHAEITVCDISKKMLEICQENTAAVRKQHGVTVNFMEHDIATDPINGKYDLVVSGLALQWLEFELPKVISKVREHLTSNGKFMFSTLTQGTFRRLKESFKECNVPFPGPMLYEKAKLSKLLIGSKIQFETYKDYYPNVLAFLQQLKSTGAVNATGKHVNVSELRRVIRNYALRCPENEVIAEYHLAYCFMEK